MLTTEEIRQFMEEDNVSQKKQFARKGQEYYDGDHDIRHYRMFYYNEDGNLVEDKTRKNIASVLYRAGGPSSAVYSFWC